MELAERIREIRAELDEMYARRFSDSMTPGQLRADKAREDVLLEELGMIDENNANQDRTMIENGDAAIMTTLANMEKIHKMENSKRTKEIGVEIKKIQARRADNMTPKQLMDDNDLEKKLLKELLDMADNKQSKDRMKDMMARIAVIKKKTELYHYSKRGYKYAILSFGFGKILNPWTDRPAGVAYRIFSFFADVWTLIAGHEIISNLRGKNKDN